MSILTTDQAAKTIVHDAAGLGHDTAACLLLDSIANTQIMDKDGKTPMNVAMMAVYEAKVRLFISHNGAILNQLYNRCEANTR
ncbi:hypothetical protein CORC01_12626 [Colletotrichum orchidophilum]|uniref:Uncharacterized protein n=1 Tax=Colletotrichum orchidophilum TaxID=1209926 RepID=A0A1G4ASN2_9PEZI|nr:uncharacterized protein CORC01_12626 [Colletotrichum orchidophilum]OHE92111.1 hypothetical protein CORC01_12626 [Colletotrichum orchidophilum]